MISARGITGIASHGKHTRATEHAKKLGNPKLPRKRIWQFWRAQIGPNWQFSQRKILFPNFFACSVTPCMLTMTMLPERILVHVHYLAHNRLYLITVLLFGFDKIDFVQINTKYIELTKRQHLQRAIKLISIRYIKEFKIYLCRFININYCFYYTSADITHVYIFQLNYKTKYIHVHLHIGQICQKVLFYSRIKCCIRKSLFSFRGMCFSKKNIT